MSVVCCRVEKETIEIASDSIIVRGFTQGTYSKLERINEMIVGGVGAARDLALLFLFCQTHKPESSTTRGVLAFWAEFCDWHKEKTDIQVEKVTSVIIAFLGKCFSIENYFIQEINDYSAIGAGSDYALSALYLGHNVEKAVKTACELSIYCEEPIIKYSMGRHAS
jgi:ATP-dependent protease HslVU (ClpYQ) peptidase subunit